MAQQTVDISDVVAARPVAAPAHRHLTAVSELAVAVHQLRKVYPGDVEAVKGIDFEVWPGEVFGLLGPNGAGKSTFIGMLTTTIAATAGTASLAGIDVATRPLEARAISAVVFQEPVVDRSLTGRRNLEIHARLWGLEPSAVRASVAAVVETFRLAELVDRPVGSYSGGERRRLEIARALLSRPRLLFLDEPTVGLDPRIRHEILDLIAGLRDRSGMTILLTTHYLDEAERLCDRVAIVHEGRIVALDSPHALLAGLGPSIVEWRVDGEVDAALAALEARGVSTSEAFAVGSTVTVPLHGTPATEAVATISNLGVPTAGIGTRAPTLDDVYLSLTGARLAA
jgi:ABC-2 type transport system ATP-binding protein